MRSTLKRIFWPSTQQSLSLLVISRSGLLAISARLWFDGAHTRFADMIGAPIRILEDVIALDELGLGGGRNPIAIIQGQLVIGAAASHGQSTEQYGDKSLFHVRIDSLLRLNALARKNS